MRFLACMFLLVAGARGQEDTSAFAEALGAAQSVLFDVELDYQHGAAPGETCARHIGVALHPVASAPEAAVPSAVRSHPGWQDDRQSLRVALFEFELAYSRSAHPDTLRDAFRQVLYAFHRVGQPYFLEKAVTVNHRSVILFAASLTCDCQRRLCDEYTAALIRLGTARGSAFHLIIIDAGTEPELLEQYGVTTIPSAIIVDGSGKELRRVDATESISDRLGELER